MHDAQGRSAFSLSPLYGFWRSRQDKRIHVHAGASGWLRISLLDDALFETVQEHLLRSTLPAGKGSADPCDARPRGAS